MESLVFLEPNRLDAEPFTTSDVIAQCANITHRSVYLLIEKHSDDIKEFGRVSFEMTPLETKGGMQEHKIYHLNEQQATLLITFLKNTESVRKFKKDLVREFYRMRNELTQRQIQRSIGKPIRRTLTDAIRDSGEDARMHGHAYSTYTDLAYKAATGKIARQLRLERGANSKAIATDFLTANELELYTLAENRISMLLDMGVAYEQAKTLITLKGSVKFESV